MFNTPSQRGFIPAPLMNNQYAASFPAGSSLPTNPNPLSKTQPVHATSADAGGIQQAMAKRAMSSCNMRPSAAGEGDKKYKIDPAADAKGEDAFKSLDEYMKKAGLNSFQASFFGRLIQAGMGEQEIRQAVKLANDRFGEKVAVELNSGIEKIAIGGFLSKALPLLGRAGNAVGKYFAPAAQVAQKAAPAVTKAAPAAKQLAFNFGDDLASAATKTNPSLATKAMEYGSRVSDNVGRMYKNPIVNQALTGAGTGAFNPNTGLMSEDPSLTGILGGMGVGALTGGAFGKFAPNAGRTLQDIQRRAMAGAGAGYSYGMGANALGYDVDPSQMARYGQFAGLLPGRVPRTNLSTTSLVKNLDPMTHLGTGLRSGAGFVGRGLKSYPGTIGGLAAAGGIGYGATQLPGAVERGLASMKPDESALANAAFENPAVQQRLGQLDQLIQQGGQTMQGVQDASQRANNMMSQFTDEQGNFSLGNLLGGLGGQAGQFFSQNQNWLIPLLLGGLGAAGGYGLGGGGGAALGGIGLPLAYMMMQNPQMLSSLGGSPQTSVAQQQAAQQQATEDGRVQEFMRDPTVSAPPQQQGNIIQQQQQQQTAANPYFDPKTFAGIPHNLHSVYLQ